MERVSCMEGKALQAPGGLWRTEEVALQARRWIYASCRQVTGPRSQQATHYCTEAEGKCSAVIDDLAFSHFACVFLEDDIAAYKSRPFDLAGGLYGDLPPNEAF